MTGPVGRHADVDGTEQQASPPKRGSKSIIVSLSSVQIGSTCLESTDRLPLTLFTLESYAVIYHGRCSAENALRLNPAEIVSISVSLERPDALHHGLMLSSTAVDIVEETTAV